MVFDLLVGAFCERPRANTVRPYGFGGKSAPHGSRLISLPCVRGGGSRLSADGGVVKANIYSKTTPQSCACAPDSSPYTGEPTAAAGSLNGKSLYGTTRLADGFRKPKERGASLWKRPNGFYVRSYASKSGKISPKPTKLPSPLPSPAETVVLLTVSALSASGTSQMQMP